MHGGLAPYLDICILARTHLPTCALNQDKIIVKSQISHDIGYMWNLKKKSNIKNLFTKKKLSHLSINNLRYADDITLVAEGKTELKSLLMKVREERRKAGLKLNIQKTKIMAFSSITSQPIDGETMETVRYFIFLGSKNDCRWRLQP